MAEADEVKLLADAKKLAMPERCAHTNWKVRNTAYEEIRDACKQVYDENDPCLAEYGELCFILLLMISAPLVPHNYQLASIKELASDDLQYTKRHHIFSPCIKRHTVL